MSKTIKGTGANRLPLDTERGYHIQYANQQSLINRPVSWSKVGFYATPMDKSLRIAGTVEIAGHSPKHNQHDLSGPANFRSIH